MCIFQASILRWLVHTCVDCWVLFECCPSELVYGTCMSFECVVRTWVRCKRVDRTYHLFILWVVNNIYSDVWLNGAVHGLRFLDVAVQWLLCLDVAFQWLRCLDVAFQWLRCRSTKQMHKYNQWSIQLYLDRGNTKRILSCLTGEILIFSGSWELVQGCNFLITVSYRTALMIVPERAGVYCMGLKKLNVYRVFCVHKTHKQQR